MKTITAVPGKPDQLKVSDLPDPPPEAGSLLVQGRLLGICGTDLDIVENGYGWTAPPAGPRHSWSATQGPRSTPATSRTSASPQKW